MKPIFSRETVVDRRQPQIRWSAVLAGSAIALGLWNLFNLLFVGGAMTAVDPDEIDSVRNLGIGAGIGSVLAPLLAMFIGGIVAGRLASHYDRRVAAGHGALVWALTSVVGLAIMAAVASNLVDKRTATAHANMAAPPAGASAFIDDEVRLINQHLKAQNAPPIETSDFLDAARYAAGDGARGVNRDAFISRLDANTDLSRPEAEAVFERLGDRAPDTLIAAQQLALHREQALEAAEDTGNMLLSAGVALFLCLATAMAGALIGAGLLRRGRGDRGRDYPNRDYDRPDTIPGPAPGAHVTAPYPTPPAPPIVADPNVRRDPLE